MPTLYPPDTVLHVRPFQHKLDGDLVTIGDNDRQVYLSLPQSGLGVLQDLADGHTVSETARRYEERTGRPVDIDGFVSALEDEGFVDKDRPAPEPAPTAGKEKKEYVGHLSWISERTAKRLVSAPVVLLALLVTAGGIALIVNDPGVMPSFQDVIYPKHLALLTWITFAFGFTATMFHEFAHVVAARAAGVPSRIRLGHRLFIPVIETDMTGIWLVDKRKRYLAFLAGLILDSASFAVLIGVLWAERRGYFALGEISLMLINGVAVTYMGRIYWQAFLFVRTDFYYTLATALDCKSLMTDTQHYVENLVRKVHRQGRAHDQSGLSRKERNSVRFFSLLWLIGRFFAIMMLVYVTVPVMFHYFKAMIDYLVNPATIWNAFDFVTAIILSLVITVLGLAMWGKTLYQGASERRARRRRQEAREAAALSV